MKKILLILGILFFNTSSIAQDAASEIPSEASTAVPVEVPTPEEKEVEDLEFKTGVISSTGSKKQTGAVIDTPNLDGVPGEEQNAVSGSVSNNKGKCVASVSNNSSVTSYSVSYEAQGSNERGVVAFRKNFSARLSPGQTVEREFACREGLGMSLIVKSGKKVE